MSRFVDLPSGVLSKKKTALAFGAKRPTCSATTWKGWRCREFRKLQDGYCTRHRMMRPRKHSAETAAKEAAPVDLEKFNRGARRLLTNSLYGKTGDGLYDPFVPLADTNVDQLPDTHAPRSGCPVGGCGAVFVEALGEWRTGPSTDNRHQINYLLRCHSGHFVSVWAVPSGYRTPNGWPPDLFHEKDVEERVRSRTRVALMGGMGMAALMVLGVAVLAGGGREKS